jgi:hypothetical protein
MLFLSPSLDPSRPGFAPVPIRPLPAALLAIAVIAAPGTSLGEGDGRPLFRFVQVNNLHVHYGPPNFEDHCVLANEKARWVVERINGEKDFPLPDFVVAVGDMIDGEPQRLGPRLLAPDFKVFQEIFKPLRCPLYPVMGNHEDMQQEGNPDFERPYRDSFGADRVNYSLEHKGLVFIVLNDSGAPGAPPERPRRSPRREAVGCGRS